MKNISSSGKVSPAKRSFALLFLLVLLISCLTGCAASKADMNAANDSAAFYVSSAPQAAPAAYKEEYGGGSYYAAYEAADYDYDAEEEYIEETTSPAESDDAVSGENRPAADSNEKLIYTCNISMQTVEFEETMTAIKEQIASFGGFIEAESMSDNASNWYYSNYQKRGGTLFCSLTVRIPSKNYNDFIQSLDGHGKIMNQSQQVENITRQYSETETTIASLKTQEARLLDMMEAAETIEDMITVEARLTEVQNELKIYQNRLSSMDTDVAYSTVNLGIQEVLEYTPDPTTYKTLTFLDRLKNSFANSWDNISGFLEGTLFFIIEIVPVLILLGLIFFVIFLLIRKIVRAYRKKHPKQKKGVYAAPAAPSVQNDTFDNK